MSTVETPREVHAQAKWVRSPARKARLVTDQIRGRTVPEARTILAFSQRAIAREVEKVLNSAVANAESRADGLNPDEMVIAAAYADEGPTMKRWRARARGRVARIRKRTCHISVRLREVPAPPAPPPPAPKAEATETTAKPKAPARKTTSTRKTTTRKKTGAKS